MSVLLFALFPTGVRAVLFGKLGLPAQAQLVLDEHHDHAPAHREGHAHHLNQAQRQADFSFDALGNPQ